MTLEKYRPSNGTEGDAFMARFCERCAFGLGESLSPCLIVGATMAFDVDDPEYPTEWVEDAAGPRCTAFIPAGEPAPAPRCVHTQDMFSAPAAGDDGRRLKSMIEHGMSAIDWSEGTR